jgi:TonB-linked SusC/RagA family outer membrane protein
MKLTTILLTVAVLQVAAKGSSQAVTLSGKDLSLKQVFAAIEQQTGFVVLCDAAVLQDSKPVTVAASHLALMDFLNEVLKDQALDFSIRKKTIFIKKSVVAPGLKQESAIVSPPPSDIHGRVVDSTGAPLEGASVTVKGKKGKGVVTNEKGEFDLKEVDDGATLVISFTGYVSQELKLKGNNSFNIKLVHSDSQLDQVQVIAYGTTSERLSTGDITTVTSKEIEEQNVTDPILALEGRVPGLYITQSSGFAGSGINTQILGQMSLQSGNNPLFVVDGVPYTSTLLPQQNTVQGNTNGQPYPSPFAFLNPGDIESITVLKDADATSIYGSRAANGAILITTKKGKPGQTKVDINLMDGIGQMTRHIDMMNTPQYLGMRHEALLLDGITSPASTDFDINGTYDSTRNINWQKALLNGLPHYTTLSSTTSGGSVNTQYLVGVTYHRETTVFPISQNYADSKGSLHFNLNSSSNNQKFKFQLNGSYQFDYNLLPNTDLTGAAVSLSPDAPALYNKDGSINWAPDSNGNPTWSNPLSFVLSRSIEKTNNLVSNMVVEYKILPGLEIKSNFGYTNLQSNETWLYPQSAVPPIYWPFFTGLSWFTNNSIDSWIVEPQAEERCDFIKGKLDLVVGATMEQNTSYGQQISAQGFSSDLLNQDVGAASNVQIMTPNTAIYKYNALFGRLNYNWEDKYIVNLTGRRDGSSRFGPENQFHDFWSLGGGWLFSNENFMKRDIPFLSFGKLSASYGTTGNDQIGNYAYESTYYTLGVSFPYQGASGLAVSSLANPFLQWELTKKGRVGMDLGFLKERILIAGNFFRTVSSNQLAGYILPSLTGFGSITENFPATFENSGLELAVNTVNINSKIFRWTSKFNMTVPKNRLLSFPNLDSSYYASALVIGKPVNITKVFNFAGVNKTTGMYQFMGADGQITSNPNSPKDNTVIIDRNPKIYGGFINTLSYKEFGLDIFFQFAKYIVNNSFINQGSNPGSFSNGSGNQPVSVLNGWLQPGDYTNIQRFNSNGNYNATYSDATNSSGAFSNASYVRLKNIAFSWRIPETWKSKLHLVNARLYVQGQNLLTFTRFTGLDPETGSSTSLPPLRIITLGVQLTM